MRWLPLKSQLVLDKRNVEFLEKVEQRHRIEWDAIDERSGGAQRTAWEILMDMNRFEYRGGEEDSAAVALVLDLATSFERVSLPVVWAWATHFFFPRKILRVLCGYSEHQRRVHLEGCVAEPRQTVTAIFPGSKWNCLLPRVVLQDALGEATKGYPLLNLRVFVDDITGLLMRKTRKWLK